MFGAIIGDIVGSRFEFTAPPQPGFTLFTNECDYTDDTICTIAIADAVIHGRSYKDSLQDWCRRYPHPMGSYGGRFLNWINSDNPQPNNSCGNGSAMRVSSIGWLFDDYDTVLEEARKSAEVSHNHPEGIKGAQCVATLIYWLRTCRINKDGVERAIKRKFGYEIPPLADIYKIGRQGHFDGICQETVPWAIRCFIDSHNFEEAIRLAVMAGGDTDTKADITGAIAEAYYDIPNEIIEQAHSYLPDDISQLLDDYFDYMKKKIKD